MNFSVKRYSFETKNVFSSTTIIKTLSLAWSMIFIKVKLRSALQKTVPGGLTTSSFLGRLAIFSAGTLGSDQTFRTLGGALIRLCRR